MKHTLSKVGLVIGLLALILVPAVMAQSGNTWTVNFFPNLDWAGSPASTQFVPALNFNWGTNAPASNMPADNWTLRATSTAYFVEGVYRFSLLADDELVFVLDKNLVIDIPLSEGNHSMQVDFREFTGDAYLFLSWGLVKPGDSGSSGGGATNPNYPGVPPLPPSQSSVTTRYGDYTPCIQQNIHQANCFKSDGAWDSPNLGSIQMEPKLAGSRVDVTQKRVGHKSVPPVFCCTPSVSPLQRSSALGLAPAAPGDLARPAACIRPTSAGNRPADWQSPAAYAPPAATGPSRTHH